MGKERLLPTGKQLFVCDNIFQGEIAGGGNFHGCVKNTKKKKERKRKRKQQQQQKTNKHKISMTVPGVKCQGWKDRDNRSKLCSLGGPVSTLARILECEIYLISFWLE